MRKLLIIFPLLIPINLFGRDYKIDTVTINSKILLEDRTILIFTPQEFNYSDAVSIIYMVDGEFSKNRFEQINIENNTKTIGIGIINTDRRRDLLPTNHADKFNDFIEKELFKRIEGNLNVKERILFGHSFGGAFTLYSMINKPSLFDKYIASSPTPIMGLINLDLYQQLSDRLTTDIKFYLSYGSKDMRQVKKWASTLANNLTNLKTEKFLWTSEIFDGEDHHTADKISIVNGLKY
jgi:predicted alpha/beta superfamily hydrolase